MKAGTCAIFLGLLLALGSGQREPDARVLSTDETLEREDTDLPPRTPSGSCQSVSSCKECILSHHRCAWCKQLNFTAAGEEVGRRCAPREELLARGCPSEELEEPRGQQEVLQDEPLSQGAQGDRTTQLAPQRARVKLRLGETQRLQVRFRRVEGYPVDLYYLMDLSYSMKDDLERVRQLGHALLVQLRGVTHSVRIGFGSFVDKTVLPFVNTIPSKLQHPCPSRLEKCQPPFSFRHVLPLTDNASAFEYKVEQQSVSGNLDSPEGGFDAILQAALCQEQIGWRNVSRLLVFTSDDIFHTAGDGKLGGIFMPSDGHCHLDANGFYSRSRDFDYPSVGQVAHALSAANIQPIFAVTSPALPVYKELSKLIPKSAVGELSEDSSNVVQLIMDAYNSLSSTVTLEHSPPPAGIHISYESQCGSSEIREGREHQGQCSQVRINQTVSFWVNIRATSCLPTPHLLKLRALGFSEELSVELHTLCDCNCSDVQLQAPHCSHGQGDLRCGVCSCAPGRVGRLCECSEAELSSPDLETGCRAPNGTGPLCSGKGQCQCGRCSCSGQSSGDFCECDNASCERHEGILCAGFGQCRCGVCHCDANHTGQACECSKDTSRCESPSGFCNGHGSCHCNQCQCLEGYYGATCDQCPGCKTPCEKHRDCAECGAFKTGPLANNCSLACAHANVTVGPMPTVLDDGWCKERSVDNQLLFFLVESETEGRVVLRVKPRERVADHTQAIVLGCTGGIVVVGLVLVLAYRLTVEIYDRREYNRFEKERKQLNWNQDDNPLYRSAVTTTINPRFQKENLQ